MSLTRKLFVLAAMVGCLYFAKPAVAQTCDEDCVTAFAACTKYCYAHNDHPACFDQCTTEETSCIRACD